MCISRLQLGLQCFHNSRSILVLLLHVDTSYKYFYAESFKLFSDSVITVHSLNIPHINIKYFLLNDLLVND